MNRPLSVHRKFIPQEKNVFSTSSATVQIAKPLTRHVSSDISDAEMDPILPEIDEICEKFDLFRQTLYGDVPEIKQMNKVSTANELLEILRKMDEKDVSKVVVCQTVIILWDILRQEILVRQGPVPIFKPKEAELERIHQTLFGQPEIQRIFDKLRGCLENGMLTFDEMSCVLM